jgi:hypothetical protein
VGRATAAAAALGTVLAPTAASGAEARRPAVVTPAAPTAPAKTTADKCAGASDWRLQKSAYLTFGVPPNQFNNGDQVQLFYSPSNRCVYGKFLGANTRSCEASLGATCKVQVTVVNADGSMVPDHPTCYVPSGTRGCTTAAIDDAGKMATAEGWTFDHGSPAFYGKTAWW